jgi:predicted transcriptional regulator
MNKNIKTFTFKYNPSSSLDTMFANMEKAVKTGKPNIQPKNVIMSNNLEAIYRCITPSRWEIFTCLVEKKPTNITELANLLKKDYANV